MKHNLKIFLFVMVIAVLTAIFMTFSVSAANTNVVYISSNGTGDGSSPDAPLGNKPGYIPGNKTEPDNAFYRGLDKLKSTGGTLVIVGDVAIDCVESRFATPQSAPLPPSEFKTPKFKDGVSLTVTSVYNGVDYRKNGAKLILDYNTCNTTAFAFGCSTTLEKINIQYKYFEGAINSWNTPFILGGGGYNFTVGEEVDVSSFNTKTNSPGDQYPILIGGHRYAEIKRSYNFTVKSGTWSEVIAGSYGIPSQNYGKVNGDVTLTVTGGKIGTLVGTGAPNFTCETIYGILSITIIGGEIDKLYLVHPSGFAGSAINVNLTEKANVKSFNYAAPDFIGSMSNLVKKVNLINRSGIKITPPEDADAAPVTTQPPATSKTETPESTTAPETQPLVTSPTDTPQNSVNNAEAERSEPYLAIWVILIIVAAVIGTGTFVINKIKLNMLK